MASRVTAESTSRADGAATRFFSWFRVRTPERTASPLTGHAGKAPSSVVQANRSATHSRPWAMDGRIGTECAADRRQVSIQTAAAAAEKTRTLALLQVPSSFAVITAPASELIVATPAGTTSSDVGR